jgi:integrase
MLRAGGEVRSVSEVMGHSDQGFTLRVYGHSSHADKAAIMAGVDAAYREAENGGTVLPLVQG